MACVNCQNKINTNNNTAPKIASGAAPKSRGMAPQSPPPNNNAQRVDILGDLPCENPVSVPCVLLVVTTEVWNEADDTLIFTIPPLPPASAILAVNQYLANHVGTCFTMHYIYTCLDENVFYVDVETTQAICGQSPCAPPYVWNPQTNTCVDGNNGECTNGYPQYNPITGTCCPNGQLFSQLTGVCEANQCPPLLWNPWTNTCCSVGEIYNVVTGTCSDLDGCPYPQYNPITETCCTGDLVFSWVTQSCVALPVGCSGNQWNPYTGTCCPNGNYFSWLTLTCLTLDGCPPNQVNPFTGNCCGDGSVWCWANGGECVVNACPPDNWNVLTCTCSGIGDCCLDTLVTISKVEIDDNLSTVSVKATVVPQDCLEGSTWAWVTDGLTNIVETPNPEYPPLTNLTATYTCPDATITGELTIPGCDNPIDSAVLDVCAAANACAGVSITKDAFDYGVVSLGTQDFTGATYLWQIIAGTGAFTTPINGDIVQLTNQSAATVLKVTVTFANGAVCTAQANASMCSTQDVSGVINTVMGTNSLDFSLVVDSVGDSATAPYWQYQYTVLDNAVQNGTFATSLDGVTFYDTPFPNGATINVDVNNYAQYIRYTLPNGTFVIRYVYINPFSGDVNTLVSTVILFGGQQNAATVVLTGATITGTVTWGTTGDIEIVSGQGTDTIIWTGCEGAIYVANMVTSCGGFFIEPRQIDNCADKACKPPTLIGDGYVIMPYFNPESSPATNTMAIFLTINFANNLPVVVTWAETDPNSAVTIAQSNNLWAVVDVKTTLIVATTDIHALIETDCGDLNVTIPFTACDNMVEIQSCQLMAMLAVDKEGSTADSFTGVTVGSNIYNTMSAIPILGNINAVADITAWLNTNVLPTEGGTFIVQAAIELRLLTIAWVKCQDDLTNFEARFEKDAVTYPVTGVLSVLNTPLFQLTAVYSNNFNPPTGFTWVLNGVVLESGTLTDETIIVSGDGTPTVTTTYANGCDPIDETTTVETQDCGVNMINHANTTLLLGNIDSAQPIARIWIIYKGTGTLSTVTVDYGDGSPVVPIAFVPNFPAFGTQAMLIQHTYASLTARYNIDVSGTDSNSLDFKTNQILCFDANTLPPYLQGSIYSERNMITTIDMKCCGNCVQQWVVYRPAITNNTEFATDTVVSDTLRVQGVNYPCAVTTITQTVSQTIPVTLSNAVGVQGARFRTIFSDGSPYNVDTSFEFTTA